MIAHLTGMRGLWGTLFMSMLVFGFAPGATLRAGTVFLTNDDPRRQTLIAELYSVPRWHRPIWVAEQLEVCLFEGIKLRRARRAARVSTAESFLTRSHRLQVGAYAVIFSALTIFCVNVGLRRATGHDKGSLLLVVLGLLAFSLLLLIEAGRQLLVFEVKSSAVTRRKFLAIMVMGAERYVDLKLHEKPNEDWDG